ncbi:MAG: prolyl oligopeptidase family serine peptidase, partial [Bacteroidota bacterium]
MPASKKKKPEDMPKDSIAILELGKETFVKIGKVKSYKTPEKAAGWVAYHKEKDVLPARQAAAPTQKTVDSLKSKIDSLVMLVQEIKNVKAGNKDMLDADEEPASTAGVNEGSDLVLRSFSASKDRTFKNVTEYFFNPLGTKLVMEINKTTRDSASVNAVLLFDLRNEKLDTVLKGGNDFKNFVFTEDGNKLAFVAERDTAKKATQKYYELYLYKTGDDRATVLIDKHAAGMHVGMTVSENANISFSKSGKRLLFGTAPLPLPKDTTLVDIDLVKVDVWNYKDDYLQSQQLFQLNNELKRSYLAVYDFAEKKMEQLATKNLQTIVPTNEGDGDVFIATTDTGRRVQAQWNGGGTRDVYAIDVKTGKLSLVKKNHEGQAAPSSTGKYILLYDNKAKNYFAWDAKGLKNITAKIKVPLYNEENDVPDDPNAYGVMGWHEGDSAVYVYDRYDVWKVDPAGVLPAKNMTGSGRVKRNSFRYLRTDADERFIKHNQTGFFRVQNQATKKMSLEVGRFSNHAFEFIGDMNETSNAIGGLVKAKNSNEVLYSKEAYNQSPNIFLSTVQQVNTADPVITEWNEILLSNLNPQQSQYNWGTAELFKWQTFDAKPATGILYKPEDFDAAKKYPMLIYFYEKLSDGLYNYIAPAPTPSRLNIPFFVSRGYLVFAPDISYTKGQPGKDAYNYIVSGAQALAKNKWVDAKNIGIQGQSWGGYQVAYLITRTNMFKAAWAGAPVVNMFSAYGGIRWESGVNRQFQYEKGQSRIGATPWERPDLYIESSPFFHLKKVNTPLVIMSNDADGAVPWYQGIEFFTAMRRLDKKVWLLNYNGEAHNLVERKNRKDIQIREQQYF